MRHFIILLILLCVYSYTSIQAHEDSVTTNTAIGHYRPYSADSPWNTPIGPDPLYDSQSKTITDGMTGIFGVDPTRYTYPVYLITTATQTVRMRLSGVYSHVGRNGTALSLEKKIMIQVPIPPGAAPAKGKDGQIVFWNPVTGDEWGFWRVESSWQDGIWRARNGYHYNTRWNGFPPDRFLSRGAGVPYLLGLIRPWEIEQGHIDHAIAFGMNYPSPLSIYPATKSDGKQLLPHHPPMGTRFQLDPTLTDADFRRWGLDRTGRIIALAMQKYGMILIDRSGHPKLYAEYNGTADWDDTLDNNTVRAIPYSALRMLRPEK